MRRLVVALVALASAAACGHKAPPIPPLPRLPESPHAVGWRQRGNAVEIDARYRLAGPGGKALKPPAAPVVLYVGTRTAAEASAWDAGARDREFERSALAVPLPEFADAATPHGLARRDALPVDRLGEAPHVVAALVLADKRARSLPSHRVALALARPALAPLEGFAATPVERGVKLSWVPPTDARAVDVRIYRRAAGDPEPWDAWRVVPAAAGEAIDETAHYGEDLVYSAAAALAAREVPVESAPASAQQVAYRDVYPPEAPRDLDLVAEVGQLRVLWYPGGSPDETAVAVERQRDDETGFREVARVSVPDASYVDRDVEPAHRYRYRVAALDKAGNRTVPVEPTGWESPRAAEPPAPVPPEPHP